MSIADLSMHLDLLLSQLLNVEKCGDGFTALCPAHDDNRNSLSIGIGDNGKTLLHCHAGCEYASIKAAIDSTSTELSGGTTSPRSHGKIVATYDYRDEVGKLLSQVCRMHPKNFRQRRPNGSGWIWSVKDVRKVPYRLPELIAADINTPVFIVEGEKDVERLVASGLVATCNAGGAGKWGKSVDSVEPFRGRTIVIIPDNDQPGAEHAHDVAGRLSSVCGSIRIVELPTVPPKGDVSDYLDRHDAGELLSLVEKCAFVDLGACRKPVLSKGRYSKRSSAFPKDDFPTSPDGFDKDIESPDKSDSWTSISTDEGRTDAAFARRFLRDYGDDVRWVPEWKSWLMWDGCRWKIDVGDCAVTRAAQAVSDSIWHEVVVCRTNEAVRFAQDMSKPGKWASALKAAAAACAIAVSDLNRNRWLIPCLNGTVDLRTGKLRAHRKEDLLTTLCPTEFSLDAASIHWSRFLDGAIPSQEVQDYLQRLCGYALAGRGEKSEEILPIFWGEGCNGKSRFIEAIRGTVGSDFATSGAQGLLTERANDRHATERASLYGKRFVFCSESGRGALLDEELIKSMTGGEVIKARFCHKDEFEFLPSFTIFLSTNHRPTVRGTDNGIWRRLSLILWQQRFWLEWRGESGPPERRADPSMPEKLAAEHSGILSWMVRGCLAWQRDGLKAPEEVQIATAEYRTAEDLIGQFVSLRCVPMPQARVKFKDFYEQLKAWCEANGELPPKGRTVGSWLQKNGYREITSNGRWYGGMSLEP